MSGGQASPNFRPALAAIASSLCKFPCSLKSLWARVKSFGSKTASTTTSVLPLPDGQILVAFYSDECDFWTLSREDYRRLGFLRWGNDQLDFKCPDAKACCQFHEEKPFQCIAQLG